MNGLVGDEEQESFHEAIKRLAIAHQYTGGELNTRDWAGVLSD